MKRFGQLDLKINRNLNVVCYQNFSIISEFPYYLMDFHSKFKHSFLKRTNGFKETNSDNSNNNSTV